MENNKKNIVTIIVAVTLLVIFVIGLTYALFSFTGRGNRINQISTTNVTMSYNETNNGITLTNAMPMSDATGILLTSENQTFTFNVSVITGSATPVAWEIAAEKLTVNGEALSNDDVRIYLEKKLSTDSNYVAVNSPSSFIPEISDSPVGTPTGQMILDQESTTSTVTYNYILRMWVSESYMLTDTEKSFSVKINVYGKDNYSAATGISLNKNSTEILVEETETLVATVTPNDAYNDTITWSSSDTSIATVDSSGVVTGVAEGTATITARTKNGKTATCTITVMDYYVGPNGELIPTMTSNTTPYGVASDWYNHDSNSAYAPWKAFDGNTSTKWAADTSLPSGTGYIQYKFPKPIKVYKWSQQGNQDSPVLNPTKIVLQGSNDGTNFTNLQTQDNIPQSTQKFTYILNSNIAYQYYRMVVTHRTANGYTYSQFCEIQFYKY